MSIEEKQTVIIERFAPHTDWMERYELIIAEAERLEPLAGHDKTNANLVEGCQSKVWLTAETEADGTMHYRAESNTLIIKGVLGLIIEVLNGERPEEIIAADLHFLSAIGLNEHLSPTRSNGVLAVIRQMKDWAKVSRAMNGQ